MTTELTPVSQLINQATGWPARAKSLQITDTESFVTATEELKAVKGLQAKCDESFNPIIEKAHSAHKEALKQKAAVRAPLDEAERIFKGSISTYQVEQDRIARIEKQRLETEQRLAWEAELEKEIETAEASGATVAEVEAIIERPAILPAVIAPPAVPKVSGIVMRETWSGRIADMWAFVQFVVKENRKDLLGLIQPDTGAVNSLARSLKSALNVPGLKVETKQTVASGRA